ncbi:MAG TPA: D-Ala-D-Ala carboxypeptidase family metallohydrolase [Polyangiaceae bacterium]|nr:D-Ala-D-Ala carboxypeptidase family metallohydrolase [Polyangiaceae bacterium]
MRKLGLAPAFALAIAYDWMHASGALLARIRPWLVFALTSLSGVCAVAPAHAALRKPHREPLQLNAFGPALPLTETAWLTERVGQNHRFDLGSDSLLALLERFVEPARNRSPEWRSFWHGRFGRNNFLMYPKLVWLGGVGGAGESSLEAAESSWGFELRVPEQLRPFDISRTEVLPDWSLDVQAPAPDFFGITQRQSCPRWKAPKPVSVVRYDGAEYTRMALVDCDGAIAADALDRLSVLARPPATPKPEMPLPLEPDEDALGGEWLPRVKLLHPRLIWVVQKIAEAFPNRSIFIMSGYRRDAHASNHQKGRALDLYVTGVDNADLFRVCHNLGDVGCGYYPNSKFVHVDVRPYGSHRVAWVDISEPGAPPEYVSSWPGLLTNPYDELSTSAAGE